MSKRIRWAILGTSKISEVMAKAIQESETGTLAAISSRSHENAKQFADKFDIEKCYDNYESLLEDPEIDAVYIGLPNHLHKESMLQCAAAGKHILCEKPFTISAAEAGEVIEAVNRANVFCMEALMYRCHPLTHKLVELVKSRVIGDIKLYHAAYSAFISDVANPTAGGSIRNLGCYPVSLVRLLAGREPVEIHATGRMSHSNHTDNQSSVLLKFADNAIAAISTADDIKMFYQFKIYGTKGSIEVTTNPWMPGLDNNRILIQTHDQERQEGINVMADKPLYSYQIDVAGEAILSGNYRQHDGISLSDSLGNIAVLEAWLNQTSRRAETNPAQEETVV